MLTRVKYIGELPQYQWWRLMRQSGALDNVPISNMIGHFQSFVPFDAIEILNRIAAFFAR